MKFHIITPFSRPQNLPALEEMFGLVTSKPDVRWYPVTHDAAHWNAATLLNRSMAVRAIPCEADPEWDICYWKCNRGLDVLEIADGDYYGFLCDDDTYDPGFFDRLRDIVNHTNAEVVTVSARRYGGSPEIGGGLLEARAEHMGPCLIGLEQYFVRGSVMKLYRFGNHGCADGEMVSTNLAKHRCVYVPNLFVNWNILPK